MVIRYLGNPIATGGTIIQSGGYTIHTFTQVGNSSIAFQGGSGSSSSTSIDEEVSIGTEAGKLTATDSDTTNLTFSLVSGNGTNDQHNSLFTVSGTQLIVAGNIDYETNATLNIFVQVYDGENTFQKAMTEWCWGFGWGDDVIDMKTRSMMNLSMIGALGKMQEWEIHCRGAITNGVSKEEIRAIIHVIGIYCGVPQALECFRVAKKVLKEQNL